MEIHEVITNIETLKSLHIQCRDQRTMNFQTHQKKFADPW